MTVEPSGWTAMPRRSRPSWPGCRAAACRAARCRRCRRRRPSINSRALPTWQTLHPDPRIERAVALARAGGLGPALPIAFAPACVCAGIERRTSVEAFAYTRLSATISAAMRLMSVGQTDAHALLARTLDRVPSVVDGIIARDAPVESFAPALDIAVMSQQYLHSRLFRS